MSPRNINAILTLAGAGLHAALVLLLTRHKLQRQYRWFFAYCCYSAFGGLALLLAAYKVSYRVYFGVYFVAQVGFVVLGLLAMNESFQNVFAVYHGKRFWFRYPIPAVVALVLLIEIWRWLQQPPSKTGTLWKAFVSFDLGGDYMMAAVFAVFVLLVFFWQVRWQQYPFGIMKGFGLFSIVGMLADLLRSDFGTKMNWFFAYAPAVAYIVACLIWLGAFLRPEPEEQAHGSSSLVNVEELVALLERVIKAIR